MNKLIFILMFSASFCRGDGAIYLPNIPGYATGTKNAGHNGIDVVLQGGAVPNTVNQGTQGVITSPWFVEGTDGTNHATYTVGNSENVNITNSLTVASDGPTGSPVPLDASFIGGKNGAGNLVGLLTGQQTMANSLACVLPSDQSAIPVSQSGTWNINNISGTISLPTGASTSALQTAGNTSLSNISGQLPATLGQKTMAASEAVVIASDQSAIPISAASLPLPTGASTSANQTTINTSITTMSAKLPAALGQTTMANSMAVTLASNQSSLPTISDNTASGTIVATNGTVTLTTNGAGTVTIQLTGVWSGSVNFNATVDGSTFFNIICAPASGTNVGNATTNGHWVCPAAGYSKIQLIGSAWVSGTATATMISSIGSNVMYAQNFAAGNLLVQASPSNTANTTPWLFTINQGGNSASVSASNALKVDGSAVTQPVAQAGRAKANAPVRNDYTSTNVTTAAYVQLVASTTSATSVMCVFDSSGQTLTIATGGAGSEVNQMNVFPGGNGCEPLAIAAGTRVSIKALSATASVGELDLNLYQ